MLNKKIMILSLSFETYVGDEIKLQKAKIELS